MQGCSLHQTKASVSMHKIHVYYPCVLWNCIYMQNLLQFQPTFTQHQHNIGPAEEPSSASVVLSIQWSILWDTDAVLLVLQELAIFGWMPRLTCLPHNTGACTTRLMFTCPRTPLHAFTWFLEINYILPSSQFYMATTCLQPYSRV